MPYINKGLSSKICALIKDISGSTITIDNKFNDKLLSLKANVTAVQSGSGDPSPDNVRPIIGWDSVSVGYVDFNQLIDKSKFINVNHSDYTIVNNDDGSLTVTIINTLASNVNVLLTANATPSYVKLPRNHRYILFDNNILPNGVVYQNGYNGVIVGVNVIRSQTATLDYFLMSLILPSGLTAQTFTIKPNIIDLTQMFGEEKADYIYQLEQSQAGAGVALFRTMFYKDYYSYNVGGTKVSIASVNGTPYPNAMVNLGGTYYGGVLDVTSGVLTVDYAIKKFIGSSDENWLGYSFGDGWQIAIADMKDGSYYNDANVLCDKLKKVNNDTTFGARVGNNNNIFYLVQINSEYSITNLTELKTWLANNPISITYPLETPFDIQLTPTQIDLIAGNNTIFADSDDVEAIYKTFTP